MNWDDLGQTIANLAAIAEEDPPRAATQLHDVLDAAANLQPSEQAAEVYQRAALLAAALDEPETTIRALEAAHNAAQTLLGPEAAEALELLLAVSAAQRGLGHPESSIQSLTPLMSMLATTDNADVLARGLLLLAANCSDRAKHAEALDSLEKARQIVETESVESSCALEVERGLGNYYQAHRRWAEAEECFNRAHRLAVRIEPVPLQLSASTGRSLALLDAERGDVTEAERRILALVEELHQVDEPSAVLPELSSDRADLELRKGNLEAAIEMGKQAIAEADQAWDPEDPRWGQLLNRTARLCVHGPEDGAGGAEELLDRALGINVTHFGDHSPLVLESLVLMGQLYLRQGRHQAALAVLNRALTSLEDYAGSAVEKAGIMVLMADGLEKLGEKDEARAGLQSALGLLENEGDAVKELVGQIKERLAGLD